MSFKETVQKSLTALHEAASPTFRLEQMVKSRGGKIPVFFDDSTIALHLLTMEPLVFEYSYMTDKNTQDMLFVGAAFDSMRAKDEKRADVFIERLKHFLHYDNPSITDSAIYTLAFLKENDLLEESDQQEFIGFLAKHNITQVTPQKIARMMIYV